MALYRERKELGLDLEFSEVYVPKLKVKLGPNGFEAEVDDEKPEAQTKQVADDNIAEKAPEKEIPENQNSDYSGKYKSQNLIIIFFFQINKISCFLF